MSSLIAERLSKFWLQPEWLWRLSPQGRAESKFIKVIHKFSTDVVTKEIEKRRQRLNAGKNASDNRGTILEILLNAADEGKIAESEIPQEIDSAIFGGHDTSSGALSWAIFLLGNYPEHQKLIQNELDEILGEDRSRDFTPDDLRKMKYLECCIKESLRIYPVVPMYGRLMTEDCPLDNDQVIPAGTEVVLVVFALHRDPAVFLNPEEFNPDRFTTENSAGRDLYAFAPFCAGPRNCLGQKIGTTEMKVILAHLLRSFNFESVNNRENMEIKFNFMLGAKDGFRMKLTER